MSPERATDDDGNVARPETFSTGTVEEPPDPDDSVHEPEVFRQSSSLPGDERRAVAGSVAVDDDPLA